MQAVINIAIVAVMSATYAVQLGAPVPLKFIPEMISALVAVYVVLAGIRTRFRYVRPAYWLVFGIVTITLICGAISNSVGSGPILAGLRYLLRPIPFFLLPAVYPFKEKQLQQQFRLMAALAAMQLPIAVYQRYGSLMGGHISGDFVSGTLIESGTQTIFLVSAISVALAMFQANRLSTAVFTALSLLFFFPTTINETKITVFILPFVVIFTTLLATPRGRRLRTFLLSVAILAAAGAIFIPIVDYMYRQNLSSDREITHVSDMFTTPDYFEKYLNHDTNVGDTEKEVGRVDSFTVPLKFISQDPVRFVFGLGLGNAAISSLGPQFSGAYSAMLGRYASGGTSAGAIVLETGAVGFLCVLVLHWLIFQDSIKVARGSDGQMRALAGGWPAVVALSVVCMFYVSTFVLEALYFFFWYLSGLLAAERMRQAYSVERSTKPRLPTDGTK